MKVSQLTKVIKQKTDKKKNICWVFEEVRTLACQGIFWFLYYYYCFFLLSYRSLYG